MGLFDKFRRSSVPKREPSAPPSGAAAAQALEIAQETVRQLNALERVDLDFTPMSLSIVEQILDRCHARGMRAANQSNLVLGLGCYFGEVVRRHTKGQWIHHKDTPLANLPQYPPGFLHLTVPVDDGDQFINVFNKIIARLDGDRGTSVTGYYKLLTSPAFAKSISANSRQA